VGGADAPLKLGAGEVAELPLDLNRSHMPPFDPQ
jgi:hypothetical protein